MTGPHGLRGQVRVRWLGDGPDHLLHVPEVRLAAGPGDPDGRAIAVEAAAPGRAGEVRMRFAGVRRREGAEELAGRFVLADVCHLEALPEGEYYAYELVGCRVFATDGSPLGVVREIWQTGAPDVLVVEREDGGRALLPAAEDLLREVDVAERRIVIEVIPGLLETV